jgi:hypothetical protein
MAPLGQLKAAVTAQQAAFCCNRIIQITVTRDYIHEHIIVNTEPLISLSVVIR